MRGGTGISLLPLLLIVLLLVIGEGPAQDLLLMTVEGNYLFRFVVIPFSIADSHV